MYNEEVESGAKIGPSLAPRETEVSRVVGRLGMSVEVLNDQVSSIEARLEGVTRGCDEKAACDSEAIGITGKLAAPQFSTKLAQEINSYVRSIEKLNDRIMNLRNRIEL